MMTARRIATTLLLLPLAEVVVFVAVALAVGFWQAVLLAMVTSVVGALLLRLAGQTHLRRFRDAPGIAITADESGRGLVMALAGILLLVPGFITDLAGILLLVPATRRRIGALVNRWIANALGRDPNAAEVVDLEPDQWRREAGPQPPSGGQDGTPRSLGHSRQE